MGKRKRSLRYYARRRLSNLLKVSNQFRSLIGAYLRVPKHRGTVLGTKAETFLVNDLCQGGNSPGLFLPLGSDSCQSESTASKRNLEAICCVLREEGLDQTSGQCLALIELICLPAGRPSRQLDRIHCESMSSSV
jgi:hypothetical protein